METMTIRYGTEEDAAIAAAIEAACFPPAEAATPKQLRERLHYYGNHFWFLFDGERPVSLVDGFVTDEGDLTDEMYERADLHNEQGTWQMIFGVNTIPEYRRRGCAGILLNRVIADAKAQGREGLVLTCKERLIPYYGKFGFRNEGISASVHGNVTWYQMRLCLGERA